MDTPIIFWIFFNVFVLLMLALDLGVFHRKTHEVSLKEALIWTFVWISLALVFNAIIFYWRGRQQALEFFTGYLVEKALSIDNIFVFIMIFTYFQIPAKYQHKNIEKYPENNWCLHYFSKFDYRTILQYFNLSLLFVTCQYF
jgi:tellurite resistance protein TerC